MKYRIEAMHGGHAIESTTASDDAIADGTAVWSIVSGWDSSEEAESELMRLSLLQNAGKLFYVKKGGRAIDFSYIDFEVYFIGQPTLPAWWHSAFETIGSWWDGNQDEPGTQVFLDLRRELTAEQRASVTRLMRRAAREKRHMPTLDPSCLERCTRAFAH